MTLQSYFISFSRHKRQKALKTSRMPNVPFDPVTPRIFYGNYGCQFENHLVGHPKSL